jgi:hypothetical protein
MYEYYTFVCLLYQETQTQHSDMSWLRKQFAPEFTLAEALTQKSERTTQIKVCVYSFMTISVKPNYNFIL